MYGERESDSVRGVTKLRVGTIGMRIHRATSLIIRCVSPATERGQASERTN